MLEAMRCLALDYLVKKLADGVVPDDLDEWYIWLRKNENKKLFPFLVESGEKIERVYILEPDGEDDDLVRMDCWDITEELLIKLPFKQRREKAIGPVIKRSVKGKGEFGPLAETQRLTLKYFKELSKASSEWSSYFKEIIDTLNRSKLCVMGSKVEIVGSGAKFNNLYEAALALIPETKQNTTVFLTISDKNGKLPGERDEYIKYLNSELATLKYCTGNVASKQDHKECPLCAAKDISIYANAVKGAGINIGNQDRIGAFQNLSASNAWKSFALCLDCADLLYIYRFHVSHRFEAPVAGERALLIPYTDLDGHKRIKFMNSVEDEYLRGLDKGVGRREDRLLKIIGDTAAINTFSIVWAKFGQNIEDVKGIITDILPSRLGILSRFNVETKEWRHPLFPDRPVFEFDLGMNGLLRFFKRPGGKKANHVNASNRLFHLKRELITALYKSESFDPQHFWREVMVTALWYLNEVHQLEPKGQQWYLFGEAAWKEGKEPVLTLCSWIRHLALVYYYLRQREVLPMTEDHYQPDVDILKPYFGPESGIDSKEKAFAFILGVLYGKVMQVQAARGVNVGANSLTWLKRLTLEGKDLPEMYNKVRRMLLTYGTEGNEEVRALVEELGNLGNKIGNMIELDQTTTCYFILIGQSMTSKILPKKTDKPRKEKI